MVIQLSEISARIDGIDALGAKFSLRTELLPVCGYQTVVTPKTKSSWRATCAILKQFEMALIKFTSLTILLFEM